MLLEVVDETLGYARITRHGLPGRARSQRPEGHPEQRSVRLAFEELGFFSREVKVLGVFPAHPFRREGWKDPTKG